MSAPCLDAPRDGRLEVARFNARKKVARIGLCLSIDPELSPLLSDHCPGAGHDWPLVAFDHQGDGERRAARLHPLFAVFLKASPLEELRRDFGIRLPPAPAESGCYFFGVLRDLVSHRGPQHVRYLPSNSRIIWLVFRLAGVDLETLQPILERIEIISGIKSGRWHADCRNRCGAPVRG